MRTDKEVVKMFGAPDHWTIEDLTNHLKKVYSKVEEDEDKLEEWVTSLIAARR